MIIICRDIEEHGVVKSEIVWQHKATANREATIEALTELEKFSREEIKTFKVYNCMDVTSFFLGDI